MTTGFPKGMPRAPSQKDTRTRRALAKLAGQDTSELIGNLGRNDAGLALMFMDDGGGSEPMWLPGLPGRDGATGAQGAVGPPIYLDAEPGEQGDFAPGPKGDTGATGATGATGPAGSVTSVASGTGLTGGPITTSGTLAVSLSTAAAACSADTTLSTSGWTDVTGCSVSLGAGTWMLFGDMQIQNDKTGTSTGGAKLYNSTDSTDYICKQFSLVNGFAAPLSLFWVVTLSGTKTIKMAGRSQSGGTGNFTAKQYGDSVLGAANIQGTELRAVQIA